MQLFNSKGNFFLSKKKELYRCDFNSKTAFFFKDIYIQTMKEKSKRDKDKMYTQPHTYSLDLPVQM